VPRALSLGHNGTAAIVVERDVDLVTPGRHPGTGRGPRGALEEVVGRFLQVDRVSLLA